MGSRHGLRGRDVKKSARQTTRTTTKRQRPKATYRSKGAPPHIAIQRCLQLRISHRKRRQNILSIDRTQGATQANCRHHCCSAYIWKFCSVLLPAGCSDAPSDLPSVLTRFSRGFKCRVARAVQQDVSLPSCIQRKLGLQRGISPANHAQPCGAMIIEIISISTRQ